MSRRGGLAILAAVFGAGLLFGLWRAGEGDESAERDTPVAAAAPGAQPPGAEPAVPELQPSREREAPGPRAGPTPLEARAPDAERPERPELPDYREQLGDPDPEQRALAAERVSVEADTFPALAELLRSDPDPRVRQAAAATLAEAMNTPEEREAVDTLLGALHDADPRVVIQALESLAFVGDAPLAAEIRFLLDSPDPEVREAAAETLDWLEE